MGGCGVFPSQPIQWRLDRRVLSCEFQVTVNSIGVWLIDWISKLTQPDVILLCKEMAHIQSDFSCLVIVSAAICEPEKSPRCMRGGTPDAVCEALPTAAKRRRHIQKLEAASTGRWPWDTEIPTPVLFFFNQHYQH
jgi:hypothetical protein